VPSNRSLAILAVIAGVALVIVGIVYFVDSASALPSFFPGHEAGSAHHHVKHGIAALVVGIGAFVFAWFQTGPAGRQATR
jgi:divalent metal cation (Fe/Co/Zn/Cd) transporter